MNGIKNFWMSILIVVFLVMGALFLFIWSYTTSQLHDLSSQTVYASPEQGANELIKESYSGVNKVKIVEADKVFFNDLWFVESQVWADKRSDGKGFSDQNYDNPGWFFLRGQEGWFFVPEDKFPELMAFGKWLFRLSV